jgi:Tol biopolymer transport system component
MRYFAVPEKVEGGDFLDYNRLPMLLDRFRTFRSLLSRGGPPLPRGNSQEAGADDRLESWKEIAGYLRRDVSTVQRWEKREGLPVHRHAHEKLGTVYAYKNELDSWRLARGSIAKPPFAAKVQRIRVLWILLPALTGVALLGTVAITRFLFINPKPGAPFRVLPVTSYPGKEEWPRYSPDGNQIAFLWLREGEGGSDIYVKHLREEIPVRLTWDGAPKASPVWSPDGRWIAYFRDKGRYGYGSREICITPARGGGPERRITEVNAPLMPSPNMAWTTDSASLIVPDMIPQQESLGLFLVSATSGEKRRLTVPPPTWRADLCPAVSPDGKTLAFTRMRAPDSGSLLLLSLADDFSGTGTTKSVVAEGPLQSELMWTAQGREILYVTGHQVSRTLWRVSVSGARPPEPVPWITQPGQQLTLSRQGNRLAYSDSYTDQDIWRLVFADRIPVRLISSTRPEGTPDISPDGGSVVFASQRSGAHELWICGSDGSNPSSLTSLGAGTPRWSPDGAQIVFDANADIYVVGPRGGNPRRITTHPASDLGGSWSGDGRWIYFTSNRTGSYQVWKTDAAALEGESSRPGNKTRWVPGI